MDPQQEEFIATAGLVLGELRVRTDAQLAEMASAQEASMSAVDAWLTENKIDELLVPLLAHPDESVRLMAASELLRVGYGWHAAPVFEELSEIDGYLGMLANVNLMRWRAAVGDHAGADESGEAAIDGFRRLKKKKRARGANKSDEIL